MTTGLTSIKPNKIVKPHQDFDASHLAEIKASMVANGWDGRPILAVELGKKIIGLTGTHRTLAAKSVLETIPVYLISETDCAAAGYAAAAVLGIRCEYDRSWFFEDLGNETASSLYAEEGE